MSDLHHLTPDQALRVELLRLCDGSTSHAMDAYAWVTKAQKTPRQIIIEALEAADVR